MVNSTLSPSWHQSSRSSSSHSKLHLFFRLLLKFFLSIHCIGVLIRIPKDFHIHHRLLTIFLAALFPCKFHGSMGCLWIVWSCGIKLISQIQLYENSHISKWVNVPKLCILILLAIYATMICIIIDSIHNLTEGISTNPYLEAVCAILMTIIIIFWIYAFFHDWEYNYTLADWR